MKLTLYNSAEKIEDIVRFLGFENLQDMYNFKEPKETTFKITVDSSKDCANVIIEKFIMEPTDAKII